MPTQLTGTNIGTIGTTNNGPEKAFDGSLSTFFDSPNGSGGWTGLDLGTAGYTVSSVSYAPRTSWASRMTGGQFQGANAADFSDAVTFYTVPSTPAYGSLTTATFTAAGPFRYVRYYGPQFGYANVAEVQFTGTAPGTPVQLTGTTIGTAGSYNSNGNTIAKATDGDLYTWFDAPSADGAWVGLDLGSARSVSTIKYAARPSWGGRMTGGQFQASTTADFSANVVTVGTVVGTPVAGALISVTPSTSAAYRYWRYLSPNGGFCNIAEFQLFGTAGGGSALSPFKVGLGPAATTTPGTVGQAPFTVWVDARDVTDTMGDRRTWNFGDASDVRTDPRHALNPTLFPSATVDLNLALTGQVVGHVYNAPGTYNITLAVARADGTNGSVTVPVTVLPNGRTRYYFDSVNGNDANATNSRSTPWRTDAKFASYAGQPNTHVTVLAGSTYNVSSAVTLTQNCVIEGEPDGSGNKPLLNLSSDGFSGVESATSGTDGVLIRNLRATAVSYTTSSPRAGVTAKTGSNCSFVVMRGRNVAVVDCDLGVLERGIYGWENPSSTPASLRPIGLLVVGCRQLDPYGISSHVISGYGTRCCCWVANTITGSVVESPTRTEDPDAGAGFSYEYNQTSQDYTVNVKAILTTRNASDAVIQGNAFDGCPVGASTSIGTTLTLVLRVLNTRNCYRYFPTSGDVTWGVDVSGRTDGYAIVENYIDRTTATNWGIKLNAANLSNVKIRGNSGGGNTASCYGPISSIPGLESDISIYQL